VSGGRLKRSFANQQAIFTLEQKARERAAQEASDASRRAAGRALALELWANFVHLQGVTISARNAEIVHEVPGISRLVFDQNLPLLSDFFDFEEARTIAAPYLVTSGMLSVLGRVLGAPQALSPETIQSLTAATEMFYKAFDVVALRVLSEAERDTFKKNFGRSFLDLKKAARR